MTRVLWRLAAIVLLLIAGLVILFTVYRLFSVRRQGQIKQAWSRLLLKVCGLALEVHSDAHAKLDRPALIVLNHISWLDIFVVNAVLPATFVAKSEIRRWPLIGWLVSGTGTVFVERGSRHAVRHTNRKILKRLEKGEHVAFFPEGTTTNGAELLPFHASLFAVAIPDADQIRQAVRVVPAALRYSLQGRFSDVPAYTGEQTLVDSILKILSAKGLKASLHWIDPLPAADQESTRQQLAQQAFDAIQKHV